MKLKIVLGIIIPVLVIIILTLLGSNPSGFSMDKNFKTNLDSSEIFNKNTYSNNAFRIGEIKITNDYFLPKKVTTPEYIVCFQDKENVRPMQQGGSIFYNEGEHTFDTDVFDLSKAASMESSMYRYSNYGQNTKTTIDLSPNQAKTLQVYYYGGYYYNYDQNIRDYDYLLLIEKRNSQSYCSNLASEDIQNAIKIQIDYPLNYCYDSDETSYDNYVDYSNIRNKISSQGTCTENDEAKTDYCLDSEKVVEYSCSSDKCGSTTYDCNSYGYTSCFDGRCIYNY